MGGMFDETWSVDLWCNPDLFCVRVLLNAAVSSCARPVSADNQQLVCSSTQFFLSFNYLLSTLCRPYSSMISKKLGSCTFIGRRCKVYR